MVECLLANEVVVGSNPVSVTYTVKPVYSGHLRFLKKVYATARCLP